MDEKVKETTECIEPAIDEYLAEEYDRIQIECFHEYVDWGRNRQDDRRGEAEGNKKSN